MKITRLNESKEYSFDEIKNMLDSDTEADIYSKLASINNFSTEALTNPKFIYDLEPVKNNIVVPLSARITKIENDIVFISGFIAPPKVGKVSIECSLSEFDRLYKIEYVDYMD